MPEKKVNLLPNLRIDLADLEAATQDFTESELKLNAKQTVLDNFARVLEGFRVQIAVQTGVGAAPGQFTVYSGIGFNRDGQAVTDEDDDYTQKSATLAVNATYYVEVEFTSSASDTDSRAFWDPEFSNGSDPSGDVLPPGRETSANVATRITPAWRIVSPISTTGFESTTNANSTKIPVAVITLAGGVITGHTTSVAKTVVLKTAQIADATLKVINSRVFPDTFTGTVDAEAITVTANDRENGILTLSAGLAVLHSPGARVIQTGASIPAFLVERTIQATDLTSGTGDQRPRMFQANEERGYAYSQNPYAATGNTDLNLRTAKEHIDFLGGQIREMKFGAMRDVDMGKTAVTRTFSPTLPRYWDSAGGLLGARTATVTVGDGLTTWGDFNTSLNGVYFAGLQAAHDALPSNGGIIFLKGNTPIEATGAVALTITKNIILVGEHRTFTNIRANGVFPAVTIDGPVTVEFHNITFSKQALATSAAAVTCGAFNMTIIAENCDFFGFAGPVGSTVSGSFRNCAFSTDIASSAGNGYAASLLASSVTFDNCSFSNEAADGAAANALYLIASSTKARFTRCSFTGSTAAASVIEINDDAYDLVFSQCIISGGAANPIRSRASLERVTFENCEASGAVGFINCDEVASQLFIKDCLFSIATGLTGIVLGGVTASSRIEISGTRINSADGGTGIDINSASKVIVRDCHFRNNTTCVRLGTTTSDISLHNFLVENDAGLGQYVVNGTGTVTRLSIDSVKLNNLDLTGAAEVVGISLVNTVSCVISNCVLSNIGTTAIATSVGIRFGYQADLITVVGNQLNNIYALTLSAGIQFSKDPLTDPVFDVSISNNSFYLVGGAAACECRAVYSTASHLSLNVSNNNIAGVGSSGGVSSGGVYIAGDVNGSTENNIVITGNAIDSVSKFGIRVNNILDRCVISNNNIILSSSTGTGIYLISAAGAALFSNAIINGNNISGLSATSVTIGINLILSAASSASSRFVISNNIVHGNTSSGISVAGNSANECVSINGNVVDTDQPGSYGIFALNLARYAITGNIVNSRDVTAVDNNGIVINTCVDGVICGNDITVSNTSGWNLNFITSSRNMVSGNKLHMITAHNRAINTVDSVYMVGNMITGCSAAPITITGTSRYVTLPTGVADNSAGVVAAHADHGLNWWSV